MHKNESLLRNLIEAFNTKNIDVIVSSLKSDIVWRWLGTEFITDIKAGTYVGLDAVATQLSGVDSGIKNYHIDELLAVTANDDIGVTWMKCSYEDADGKHQEMEENWVYLFDNGVISEVWDYNRMVFLEKVRNGEINS